MYLGKEVMVKSTLGQPVVRILVAERDGRATVCRREAFERWREEGVGPGGIEVDRVDLFEYDPKLFEEMKRFDGAVDDNPKELSQLWGRARVLAEIGLGGQASSCG